MPTFLNSPATTSFLLTTGNPLNNQTSSFQSSASRFNNSNASFGDENGATNNPARNIYRHPNFLSKSINNSRLCEYLYRGRTGVTSSGDTEDVCVCSELARKHREITNI
jgi:hypothetical protein